MPVSSVPDHDRPPYCWSRPFGGFLACVGLLFGVSCGGGSQAPTEAVAPVPVRVMTIAPESRAAEVAVSGSVLARETVTLGFQVAGRIARIRFEEGDAVRKGDVIAEVDNTDYRIGVDAARAKAAQARAVFEKAQHGVRHQELAQAQVAFDQRQDEYRRMKQLYDKQSLAPNDFKKFEAAYLAAKEQLEMAREGARQEDKAAAGATVSEADAGVAIAEKHLNDTVLRATVSGIVAAKHTEAGQMTAVGTPVLTLVTVDPVDVMVGVPESDIATVHEGQKAEISVPALNNQRFEGTVRLVGVAGEPSSRTYTVKIRVPNPKVVLKPGMIAEARIFTNHTENVLAIPADAVVRDPQGATLVYLYFPEKGRAYARRVELGNVFDTKVQVRDGLKADDQVIVAGQNKLREGAAVELAGGNGR